MNRIQHGEHRFFIEEGGEKLAEITYVDSGDQEITIDHTFVSEKLRGQKIGNALVERVVQFARENNVKVVPQCSFAVKVFADESSYEDVKK